jgi:hypothetical protein
MRESASVEVLSPEIRVLQMDALRRHRRDTNDSLDQSDTESLLPSLSAEYS